MVLEETSEDAENMAKRSQATLLAGCQMRTFEKVESMVPKGVYDLGYVGAYEGPLLERK